MSTHPTSFPTDDRMSAGVDLTLALVSVGQALRVAELAHTSVSRFLENMPREAFLEDIREKTGDTLVLFGLALRLVDERNQEVISLTQRLIDA